MATFRKRGQSWSAQVIRNIAGQRVCRTASFSTKGEAQAWAALTEQQLDAGKGGKVIPGKSVQDVATEFIDKLPDKPSARWERIRLNLLLKDDLGKVPLTELNQSHLASWRDRRSKTVSDATVRREFNLLSKMFRTAVEEWKWLPENPCRGVKMPKAAPARDQLWLDDEIERVLVALGHKDAKPVTVGQRVALAFLFSLETACRAGEILNIKPADVKGRVVSIRAGKTDAAKREVPLSTRAVQLLGFVGNKFELTSQQLDANFRKYRDLAGIEDRTFHDARATAITRLAKKMDILDLARMVGHRDLSMLMVYYRKTAKDIASTLD